MQNAAHPPTRSQRIRTRMRKDADRQARRRISMRDEGRPETHAVDRAVAEAVAYLAVQNRRDGEKKGESLLKFRDIVDVASRILSHRGRFDNFASIRAVASRLRRRKEHLWTLPAPQRQKASDSAS